MLGMSWASGSAYSLAAAQAAYVARSFGMFIHFNMSTFKDVEIASGSEPVNSFDPGATLNIDQWVSTAVAMKAKYACLTAKHHDGFCLWPTLSVGHGTTAARNISQTSWYANNGQIDIVGQFTSKFRAAGIIPLLYFSVRDGSSSLQFATDAEFKTYTQTQISELLGNYGPIGGLWMDGADWWFPSVGKNAAYPWVSSAERFAFIRGAQRNCLLINNAKTSSFADSDIIVFEQVGDPASNNTSPSELVEQMRTDGNWFWKSTGNAIQTAAFIEAHLALLNGRHSSYMLNAGPDNTGVIPSNMVTTLTTVGASL